MNKVFVYGTLRKGMYNYERYFKGYVRSVTSGYVKGTLYTIQGKQYPALVTGEDMIAGEIIELEEHFDMTAVDEMEGYYGDGNLENEYHKELCDIYDIQGTIIDRLPVYRYNMDHPLQKELLGHVIEECDYAVFMKQKETV